MMHLTFENASKWFPDVLMFAVTCDPETEIEKAYRNCWQSEPRGDRGKFIIACIKRGHLSCLEFACATIQVVASRAATHQIVRHRIASYAQESQRYVEQGNTTYLVVPPEIYENNVALEIFVEAMNFAWRAYAGLLENGIKKEDARFVLPNACKSKILINMNFRAWRHFLKLRCSKEAQWEIRGIADAILILLHERAPSVFGDLYEKYILEKDIPLWTESD